MKRIRRIVIAIFAAILVFVGGYFAVQNPVDISNPGTETEENVRLFIPQTDYGSELTPEDRAKIDKWKNRPDDQTYLTYKAVFDNPKYYNQKTGEVNLPPNNGLVEDTVKQIVLKAGTQIDRYGTEDGFFTSPVNTPYEQRSCAPGSDQKPYHQYKVLKAIEGVNQGITAPWFDEPGGGLQYEMPVTIRELVEEGYLKRIQ